MMPDLLRLAILRSRRRGLLQHALRLRSLFFLFLFPFLFLSVNCLTVFFFFSISSSFFFFLLLEEHADQSVEHGEAFLCRLKHVAVQTLEAIQPTPAALLAVVQGWW
jgi:hypothetical protein